MYLSIHDIVQLLLASTDTQTLNNAIEFTAKTYHEIGQMHAEQVCGSR